MVTNSASNIQPKMASTAPKIFDNSPIEIKDDNEMRHERCFHMVQSIISEKGEKEGNEALSAAVSKNDPKAHDDICIGLMVGILGDPENAVRYYRDLTLISRDGLQTVCNYLSTLVLEKYTKMHRMSRYQLLWMIREMVKSSVIGMENICWNIMRQIGGGDLSPANLWLSDFLLDMFIDHRGWLEKFPFLLASVVYTYLRIIEDHFHPNLDRTREKEIKFVISLIRERFSDVMVIGRDLVRMLQYVARIPEFERLWMDILNNPKSLSPSFNGISHLMNIRTSRRFLQSRVTPDMEKKLMFLTSQVRFGNHKRYQDWFQRQYLSAPESSTLRCDLIRFIVGVIHPSNEILGSDIIPRWAIIGWLLTTCHTDVTSSNSKLALFYDWLFFIPDKDNIMNIEPAILVMHHSMRSHPAITATLLDFLCRIVNNFYPKEREKVQSGINASLKTILDKKVLPSLSPLFDNPQLDEELRIMLRDRFPSFVSREGNEFSHHHPIKKEIVEDSTSDLKFSDDEEEQEEKKDQQQPPAKHHKKGKKKHNSKEHDKSEEEDVLDDEAYTIIKDLGSKASEKEKIKCFNVLIEHVFEKDYNHQQCSTLAAQISQTLHEEFEGRIFPSDSSVENIEKSINTPLSVVLKALCERPDSDPNRQIILNFLAELYALQPRVGYYLLYFLSVDTTTERSVKEKANIYKDLCESIDEKYSLDICLVNDMRQCQEDDVNLFVHLVPEVFTNFPKQSIGNTDLLYLVVSCVDGRQIQTLACHIVSKDLILFKRDSFQNVLNSSLGWETFEQYALWQLVSAHDLPLDCVVPIISKLSFSKHSEALTSILMLLKKERPTAELVKTLMSREWEKGGDYFVSAILNYWIHEYEDKLSDLIGNHLNKVLSLGAGTKRKRNAPPKNLNSLSHMGELCLSHLDQFRQTSKQHDLFLQHSIQNSLQQAKHSCSENQKKKFGKLFELAESDSEPEDNHHNKKKGSKTSSNSLSGSGSTGKSPAKSKQSTKNSNSSNRRTYSESSEETSDGSEEDEKTYVRGKRGASGGGGAATGRGKNSRKRAASKISYKISSEESSDDESLAKKPAKKKRVVAHSESE